MNRNIDMRDAFIGELYKRVRADKNIVFISAEFGAPSLDAYRLDFPDQFINIGISEQNLISVAAGLALAGKSVFAYSIASFLTLRCYEQIKIDLCAMNLPVTLLGVGPCYAYSEDGPTHHATEDISVMRALSNMTIYSPSDFESAKAMVDLSLRSASPTYIRLDRGKYTPFTLKKDDILNGFRLINDGQDICIIATSVMVHRAVHVAAMLKGKGISACIIDIFRLKPINSIGLMNILCKFSKVATLEEHTLNGGLGSIMLETISDAELSIMVRRFGIKDSQLYAYGKRDTMHCERGIDKESIVRTICMWMGKKKE